MFNCNVKFTLVVTRKRSLDLDSDENEGTCKQIGIVTCSENENPSVADCTGMLDCEANLDNFNYKELQAKDFKLIEVNGLDMKNETLNANIISDKFLNEQTGTEFEDKMENCDNFYVFNQNGQTSCKCNNGKADLKLKGSVAGYKEDAIKDSYSFTTTKGEDATCYLEKEEGSSDATFNCSFDTVDTSSKTFKFTEYESKSDATNSLISLETNSATLCEEDDSSINTKSSSSGLSGGATAGIVVGSVVVVAAVGAIVAFAAIPTKVAGVAAAQAAAQSFATSSQAGFVVPSATTSGHIAG